MLPPFPLRISDNGRYFQDAEGAPFFYLADTAWELFHRLDREEADLYLRNRAEKGYTVIQAVVLAEESGLTVPNMYGHLPLEENDPARPVEAYFEHVDWIVQRANELGLVVAMLPTWGDKWNKRWGVGPEVFTPENARVYGEWLGRRYRDRGIIWMLGGDRPIDHAGHAAIIHATAAGLEAGDGGRHLMTFHNCGGKGSSDDFHNAAWLDFNTWQTGHGRNRPNHERITQDWARTPVKPVLDAEPGYEDHPIEFKAANGYLDAFDARKHAYWAVFAGAAGHTYGCHDIWQFHTPGKFPPKNIPPTPWQEAMDLPGAGQMRHLKDLLLARVTYFTRISAQEMIAAGQGSIETGSHVQATRDSGGAYALVYLPTGAPVTLNLDALTGETLHAQWFNPRTGETAPGEAFPKPSEKTFTPPTGEDWVLIVE